MPKATLALLLTLLSLTSAKTLKPYPPFSEDLTFYQTFDNGPEADLSLGWQDTVWESGTLDFPTGLRGTAMLCGERGTRLRYERRHNLSFDEPGTLLFFYRPLNWNNRRKLPRLFFWGIESSRGYISLQGANDPKHLAMHERDLHLLLLDGKRLPTKAHIFPSVGNKGKEGWHMLALTWSGDQLAIKWDRNPLRTFNNGLPLQDSDFPENSFSIGSHVHWEYLMDEFMIFSRRLSDDELNLIYCETFKDTIKP